MEQQHEFRDIVFEHLSEDFGDFDNQQRKLRRIAEVMNATLIDRRDNPRGYLISLLWQSTVDGKPLTLDDMENYCILLFIAGLDTVMNAMGHGIAHLAAHPALQDELRANPKMVTEAAEELLRRYGFVISTRMIGRDIVYDGAPMKKGDRCILYNPAANLDGAEFPEPQNFDLTRENKAHITFGGGPHRCVGSHLARIELQTLYEEMLARLPRFHLAEPVAYRCGPVIGPRAVQIAWDV
jgi:cytochrome P450